MSSEIKTFMGMEIKKIRVNNSMTLMIRTSSQINPFETSISLGEVDGKILK